jgi:inosine triphosphate pyrophosphatase
MKVNFITSNAGKFAETQQALGEEHGITLVQRNVDLPELQGDPLEVAREKCRAATRRLEGPVLIEDTSLCFHALNDLPGVYVKWFLEKTGNQGLVNLLAAYEDKTAYAQCIFAYTAGAGYPVYTFVGKTNGKIVDPRGPLTAFGWDTIFVPEEGNGKTYAEMTAEEKVACSHRTKALQEFTSWITKDGTS